jgi:hypothetical protein
MKMVAMMTAMLLSTGGLCFAANGEQANSGSAGAKKKLTRQKVPSIAPVKSGTVPGKPSSAHLAAKREMVRNQQEQRITPEKRKAAVEALKAERLKVYNAKQSVKKSQPAVIDNK